MVLNKYVSLAPLPRQGTGVVEGRVCRVSGWGYNSLGGGQARFTLRTVTVPIVSPARCNSSESFNGNITANMICAGYRTGGKDACKVQECVCVYFLLLTSGNYFNQFELGGKWVLHSNGCPW